MNIQVVLLSLPLTIQQLVAESEEDWIFRLAKSRIEKHVSSTNGLSPSWHGSGNGGYLFKGQAELDGGGEAELLLSSTLDFYQRNTAIHIYQKINEHSYASYSDTWRNPPNYYYPGRDPDGKWVIAHELSFKDEGFHVTQFLNRQLFRSIIPHSNNDEEFEAARLDFVNGTSWPRVNIPIVGIKLSDFVEGESNWKPIEFSAEKAITGEYFVFREDAVEMMANKAFTPQVALERLRRSYGHKFGGPPRRKAAVPEMTIGKESGKQNNRDTDLESGALLASSSRSWAIGAAMIILLISVIWWLRARMRSAGGQVDTQ